LREKHGDVNVALTSSVEGPSSPTSGVDMTLISMKTSCISSATPPANVARGCTQRRMGSASQRERLLAAYVYKVSL
jgi:hypothetical protein